MICFYYQCGQIHWILCGIFGFYFQRLNNYLALSSKLLGYQLAYLMKKIYSLKSMSSKYMIDIKYVRFTKIRNYFLYIIFRLFNYLIQIIQASYKSSMRQSLYARLSDPKWYVAHLRSYNTFLGTPDVCCLKRTTRGRSLD